jgi:hypothetical protein
MMFRRGKLRLAAWYLVPLTFWLMSGLFAFALFAGLSPIRAWSFEKAAVLLAVGMLALLSARNARRYQQWVHGFSQTFVELDPAGLRFRLKETSEMAVRWDEITDVKFEKRWIDSNTLIQFRSRMDACVVETSRGTFTFTAMDIPSPKKAAEEITARLRRPTGF